MSLNTKANFFRKNRPSFRPYRAGDDFYEALIQLHRNLDEEQSTKVNARLILLLANHIGDVDILQEAMEIACKHV